VSKEGGKSMEEKLRTSYQQQVENVLCVQELNRDEVGIPMLIEKSHNNDTMACHFIKGQGQ
jgi:hypothetical protein